MPDRPALDAEALAEWLALSDALLRGLVHSLNNRLTALAAFGELAALGDAEFAADRVLPAELGRLQALGAHFRLLVNDDGPNEALELRLVADDALALHAHHAGARSVRCRVEWVGALPTVRVPRWAMLRLLIALLEVGRAAAERQGDAAAVLRVTADDESIVLQLDGRVPPSPYAIAMAQLCGAAPSTAGAAEAIRLPTLLELRRRERRARDGADG